MYRSVDCGVVECGGLYLTVSDGAAQNFQLFRVWSLVFIGLSLHPRSPDRAGTGWAGVGREADRFSFVCRWHFHIMDAGDGDTVLPCYCVQYWAVEHFILLFAAAARCLKCFNWINTHFHVDTATGACGSALWILMWWEGYSVWSVSHMSRTGINHWWILSIVETLST